MEDNNSNMNSELTLIKLLGLKLLESNNSNIYFIVDESNNRVGSIERKKQYSKFKNSGISIEDGYKTVIETDTICYSNYRIINKTNNGKPKFFHEHSYVYSFNVKRNGQKIAKVNLNMNDTPSISYRSIINNDNIHFYLSNEKLYLRITQDTKQAIFDEITLVEISDRVIGPYYDVDQTYGYTRSLTKGQKNLINDIECYHNAKWWSNKGPYMNITTQKWQDWELISTKKREEVHGSIANVIKDHGKGLESFERFRTSINNLLPFKEDLFQYLFERYENDTEEFKLFIPELNKEKVKVKTKLK